MTHLTLKASVAALTFTALLSGLAQAQPDRGYLSDVPVADLKAIYLECEQQASTALLDFDAAAECSMVSEELLERGFGGSFERLLQWWRKERKPCLPEAGCNTS